MLGPVVDPARLKMGVNMLEGDEASVVKLDDAATLLWLPTASSCMK